MFRTPKLLVLAGIMVELTVSMAVLVSCNAKQQEPPKNTGKYNSTYTDLATINTPGNYTDGAVSAVNGNTVMVTNNLTAIPVTVTVSPNTVVTKGVWSSVTDLYPGVRMAVSGSKDSMGMIIATLITVPPPMPDPGNDTRGTLINIDGNIDSDRLAESAGNIYCPPEYRHISYIKRYFSRHYCRQPGKHTA